MLILDNMKYYIICITDLCTISTGYLRNMTESAGLSEVTIPGDEDDPESHLNNSSSMQRRGRGRPPKSGRGRGRKSGNLTRTLSLDEEPRASTEMVDEQISHHGESPRKVAKIDKTKPVQQDKNTPKRGRGRSKKIAQCTPEPGSVKSSNSTSETAMKSGDASISRTVKEFVDNSASCVDGGAGDSAVSLDMQV